MKVNLNLYNFGSTDDNHSKQKNVPVTVRGNPSYFQLQPNTKKYNAFDRIDLTHAARLEKTNEKQKNEKILFSSSEKSKFVKPNDAIFTKYIKYQQS